MKILSLAVIASFGMVISGSASAQDKPIPIYVFTSINAPVSPVGNSGFVDPKAEREQKSSADKETQKLTDSLKDIKESIAKKKSFRLVESPEEAIIRLEVVGRSDFRINPFSAQYFKDAMRDVSGPDIIIKTRLTASDYSLEITAKPSPIVRPGWRGAAENIARQVEEWVERNRQRLDDLN
jgi:hypothetical protein